MMLQKQHVARATVMSAWVAMAAAALAQATADHFEAASVKPSQSSGQRFSLSGGPGSSDPGRIVYSNTILRPILLNAFDVKNYQLTGPEWLDTLRFDITAKIPEGATKEQFQAMLRNLLVERFRMAMHRESKEMPIYALLPARGGPRIKPLDEPGGPAKPIDEQAATVQRAEGRDGFPVVSFKAPGVVIETKNGVARATAHEVPLTRFADFLSGRLGRPVVDTTGLGGKYSFEVYFTPDGPGAADGAEPDVFSAVQQQLGLRLEARKGAIELLVIDRAEKVPAEN